MEPSSSTTVDLGPGAPAPGRGAASAESGGRPLEILLVEDNAADVLLTQQILRRCRVRTTLTVARDGEEALAVLGAGGPPPTGPRPDLVLLDLNMPRMGGLEVLDTVKADPDLAAIPVIVLTSSVDDRDIEQAYRRHANAYVRKPGDLTSLADVMAAIGTFWGTVAVLPPHPAPGRRA